MVREAIMDIIVSALILLLICIVILALIPAGVFLWWELIQNIKGR